MERALKTKFQVEKTLAMAAAGIAFCVTAASAQSYSYRMTVRPLDQHQEGYRKTEVSEAVIGETPLVVWRNYRLNPDCTSEAGVVLRVVHPPEHGTVTISTDPLFPNYSKDDVRYACNAKRSPGNQAIYTANAGYAGRDRLVLEGSTGGGVVRRISVDLDVK